MEEGCRLRTVPLVIDPHRSPTRHVGDSRSVLREVHRVSTRSIIFDYVASEQPLTAWAERLWLRYQDGEHTYISMRLGG